MRWIALLLLASPLLAADREIVHPYIYSHENPLEGQIHDQEEKYQRYTRKAQEYKEKAEALYAHSEDSEHLALSDQDRRERYKHYMELSKTYEKRAKRASVELKSLYRHERKRLAHERDQREIERLEYLSQERRLEPREQRRLRDLKARILRRKSQTWR